MGKYFTQLTNGKYQCNMCKKTVEEYGQPAHRGWHKKQENKKTTQQLLQIPQEPAKHLPTCNCGFCKTRRDITGQ